MNGLKVNISNIRSLPKDNFCFICLKSVTSTSENQKDLLKIIFNYLKVSDEKKEVFVCKCCEEKLTKFAKLCGILDKTMMEMDYLLECVQNGIKSSSKNLKPASFCLYSVRETVAEKCGERFLNPRPKVNLERLDFTKLIIRLRSKSHISDGSEKLPSIPVSSSDSACNSSEDLLSIPDTASSSTSSHSDLQPQGPAAPVISRIENVKVNLEDTTKTPERKKVKRTNRTRNNLRCPKCFKTFATKYVLSRHNDSVHLRLKPCKCSKCTKSFRDNNDLLCHFNAVHLRHKLFKCDLCEMSFSLGKVLMRHKRAAHPNPNGGRPVSSHSSLDLIIIDAITKLNEEEGSFLTTIRKFIAENYKMVDVKGAKIVKALKKAVDAGKLTQPKGMGVFGSFKLAAK